MREAIPPPLKRFPSLYTREAYFIRNNPRWNAVQNKRRCRVAPSFSYIYQLVFVCVCYCIGRPIIENIAIRLYFKVKRNCRYFFYVIIT